jgi:hypothetical protein
MDKDFIITNWDNFYKLYAKLNPDLQISGINTKRSLLNHYIKYGFNENRKVIDDQETFVLPKSQNNFTKFLLNDTIIIEQLE